jgi:hypothetical protein
MSRVTLDDLVEVGRDVIVMCSHYHGRRPQTEMLVDYLLYGYLQGGYGQFTRQHPIRYGSSDRPKRIDFRQGGTRPVGIEFVLRTQGRNEIYGSQNRSEIEKLCRLRQQQWSTRILLLLDLYEQPVGRAELKATYDDIRAGSGNFHRHTVSIVYVHRDTDFRFQWRH